MKKLFIYRATGRRLTRRVKGIHRRKEGKKASDQRIWVMNGQKGEQLVSVDTRGADKLPKQENKAIIDSIELTQVKMN